MLRTAFAIAVLGTIFVLSALILALPTPQARGAEGSALAIVNARLFDGEAMTGPATVLVRDGLIAQIGEALEPPPGAQVIDGEGRTLLPGLIDAHVHSFGDARAESLRFGVTTSLDMFTSPLGLPGARADRDDPTSQGQADLFSAGMLATAPGGHGTQFGVPVETLTAPEEAEAWVARRLAEGSDYIKIVYMPYQRSLPSLDRATAAAVIRAAHDQGVLAVAHVSSLRAAQDMVEDGVDGLVHVFADAAATPDFLAAAAERDVFVVPTLAVIAAVYDRSANAGFAEDPHIAPLLTPAQRVSISAGFGVASPVFDTDRALANVAALHEAGVTVLAGSDAPNPGTAHGASVHQEMELLTRAGLSAEEALIAATSAPADAFGIARGRIAEGARADLILVEGDPTADITATRAITHVIKNGRVTARETPAAPEPAPPPADVVAFTLSATDDSQFGGASTAIVTPADEPGRVSVSGELRPGFPAPWVGVWASLGAEETGPADLSGFERITFRARGAPGVYRVMAFDAGTRAAPPEQRFELTEDWRSHTFDLDAFPGFSPEAFIGFSVVAGPAPGAVEFEVEGMSLE